MKKRRKKSIIIHHLENVSKEVFKKHAELITKLIGRCPGVYALYDDMGLYYVGRSTNLKGRVKHHLKDRHAASWTHFSLYLLRNEEHVGEIESLLIRIAGPRGNKSRPKGKSNDAMLKELKQMIKIKYREELDSMFGIKTMVVNSKGKRRRQKQIGLEGLVSRKTKLFRTYKEKEYNAVLTSDGKIRYNGKVYTNPSAPGKAIVKHGCNGWKFWYLKDENHDIISLDDLR
ncbi:MAG: DUF2924 domain-containing protein [Candidatus Omnitrophica bacterium]|nr:DUF2924 domain-containing protein [Candidatus Omnitrophota bacterium]